jgi:multisubunit Na+/H+ antiporter MnhB subunit
MKKRLLALAAAVAMFGLAAQSGTANAFLLGGRSPNVTAAQLVIGAGTTGAYFALTRHHHHHHHHNKFHFSAKWYGLTTVGCMGLTPILGAALVGANEGRELKSSEVFIMIGDCAVPILGGWVMQSMFAANPQWDNGTGGPTRR